MPGAQIAEHLGQGTAPDQGGSDMKAHEIMSRDVVTVKPATPVHDVAALMTEKRISGIPVVSEDGTVLGIISESDLLRRAEIGTVPQRKWWLVFFSDPDALARQYTKTHGLRAENVMTRPVISVGEDADLSEIARTLDKHKIKRLPVLRDGKLVGIISRADIVRALSQAEVERRPMSDAALEKTLLEKMRAQDWLEDTFINLSVHDGVVELNGFVASAEQRRALHVLIEETDGVHKIDDRLSIGLPALRAT
jgi:CBS domain-containing protein